ncbi:phosphomethylpyrimidine synthase ThiC [Desulfovibrio inopinatus]|uniref:phosphomethylpyrimidine synthase ThiC n=1 Tax=Desulfovibrio inopinatus TaxID=102109 RepID=UPI0004201ACB|nr:phosphomethylpyrimidine synthase ThiC [Desulfovibrio inopinatus]
MLQIEHNPPLSALLEKQADTIAAREHLDPAFLRQAVGNGTMVILANPSHTNVMPTVIGQPAPVKVNANIGVSPLVNDPSEEIDKLRAAEAAGANAVMDLSTAGDLAAIRRSMLAATKLPLGTVPLYAVAEKYIAEDKDPSDFSFEELLEEIHAQAEAGVDFMTLHCGVTQRAAYLGAETDRTMGIVSRGGSILARWMRRHKKENPLYTHYDALLDICCKHNVVISLGDGLRPGAGCDAGDAAQWEEVIILGELTKKAHTRGVQIMIEGPGHVPMHLVQSQIQGIKRLTENAPLYVLGPLTTDTSPGRDHIGAAIGGSLAAYYGADFLCYVTPAEHLTLPDASDVHEGVLASRIAAQTAETSLGRPWALEREKKISEARAALDWKTMADVSLDPCLVRTRREPHETHEECAMCGKFCAVKMLKDQPATEPSHQAGTMPQHCAKHR